MLYGCHMLYAFLLLTSVPLDLMQQTITSFTLYSLLTYHIAMAHTNHC